MTRKVLVGAIGTGEFEEVGVAFRRNASSLRNESVVLVTIVASAMMRTN
jgi:hypothetical protein